MTGLAAGLALRFYFTMAARAFGRAAEIRRRPATGGCPALKKLAAKQQKP
jgi:hypothetical protein